MSLEPALCPGCSLGIVVGGGQQGFRGTTNKKQPRQRGMKDWEERASCLETSH